MDGRKIKAYIDTRMENGNMYYYVASGKPSQACAITWRCKTYEKAWEMAMNAFGNGNPTVKVQ